MFCFLIATTVIVTAAVAGAGAGGLDSKSVNLNLETVLVFDPQDNSGDVAFIDKIQQFLGNVKTVIDHKPVRRSNKRPKRPKTKKFTDFIRNVIEVLQNYSDGDLEDLVAVVDDEIRKYDYQGCKFHELAQNRELRRFVANKFSAVQDKQGKDIKKSLDNLLDALQDAKQVKLLDHINSLYRLNDTDKMESFLKEIQAYAVKSKRANLSLARIVGNGLRSIFFDHYSNLNPDARRELRIKIETVWGPSAETITEATTTKKTFDIAKGFNFLRNLAFEFITPKIFTKKSTPIQIKPTTTTEKPKTSPHSKEKNDDLTDPPKTSSQTEEKHDDSTDSKVNNSPEEKVNDHKESKHKKSKRSKKTKKDKSKVKKEKKKNRAHKRKKTHYRADITGINDDLSPESKPKTRNPVSQQHDAIQPTNIFEYNSLINVRGHVEKSQSSEDRKLNESISFESKNTTSKKKRTFRRRFDPKSEEEMLIEFTPEPVQLGLKHDHTPIPGESLLKPLNSLKKALDTFEAKVAKKEINDINVDDIQTDELLSD